MTTVILYSILVILICYLIIDRDSQITYDSKPSLHSIVEVIGSDGVCGFVTNVFKLPESHHTYYVVSFSDKQSKRIYPYHLTTQVYNETQIAKLSSDSFQKLYG